MSFKIFTQQLLGKIKPVEVIEKKRKLLLDDYNEFIGVQNSEELVRYLELEKYTSSDAFKKAKAEIEGLRFKGSKEYNQLQELTKLRKLSSIKNYFKLAGSAALKRFEGLKDSEKLAEYDRLLEYVKEGQFAKEKNEIKSQVFKGSVEEKHWLDWKRFEKSPGIRAYNELHDSAILKKHEAFARSEKLAKLMTLRNEPEKDKLKKAELRKLERDPEIRAYFKFERSKKLRLYREMAGSHELKKYHELEANIESDEFKKRVQYLKDRTKFEKSEAFNKYSKFKQLAADEDVKFFWKFEKSGLYKNYLNVVDSFDLKRLTKLEGIISSEDYQQRRAYLEDKKKWEKSEEHKQLLNYLTMKKLPHLVKYFKYNGTNAFSFFENWEVAFEDDFAAAKIDTEKWSTRSFLSDKMLGDNYSLAGDMQAYTNGENVKAGGKLSIEVRKEKKTGKVWQPSAGFLPVEFDYTSAIVSTWNNFWLEDGILEAKIKFEPLKETVSSFYLCGENNLPRVNLLEMGTKNRLGISTLNAKGKAEMDGLDISNLKKGWYIFSLEKKGNNYSWKINESDVFATQNSNLNKKLHLNATTLVVNEIPASKLPGNFEIEWVRCYRKKQ